MVWNENNPLLVDEDKWKERILYRQGSISTEQGDEFSTRQEDKVEDDIIDDIIDQEQSNTNILSKHLTKLGWSMVKMICFIFGAQIIITIIVGFSNEGWLQSPWFDLALAFASTILIGYPLFIRSVKKIAESPKQPMRKLTSKQFLSVLAISIAIVYISNIIGTLLLSLISIFQKKEVYDPVEDVLSNSSLWIQLLYVVIVGPIMEEVIFRKYLLNRLKVYGDMPAILISGIAFGLFHMNFTQFFYATTLGCFFAYIAIRTNTILYVVLLHILINFNGGVVASYIVSLENSIMILYLYLLLNIIVVIIGICYINKYKDRIYLESANLSLRVRDYLKPKGVCTYLVISIILMILTQFF